MRVAKCFKTFGDNVEHRDWMLNILGYLKLKVLNKATKPTCGRVLDVLKPFTNKHSVLIIYVSYTVEVMIGSIELTKSGMSYNNRGAKLK